MKVSTYLLLLVALSLSACNRWYPVTPTSNTDMRGTGWIDLGHAYVDGSIYALPPRCLPTRTARGFSNDGEERRHDATEDGRLHGTSGDESRLHGVSDESRLAGLSNEDRGLGSAAEERQHQTGAEARHQGAVAEARVHGTSPVEARVHGVAASAPRMFDGAAEGRQPQTAGEGRDFGEHTGDARRHGSSDEERQPGQESETVAASCTYNRRGLYIRVVRNNRARNHHIGPWPENAE